MSAAVHEIYPPEPDLDVAIEFLKAINPDGRQMLVGQTDESSGPADTQHKLFEPGMWDEKRALITTWAAERRNVWVLPNEPRAGGSGKEGDIAFIRCVWSDTDNKSVQADALSSPATFVTDSGGGIHTFFTVYPQVAVTVATRALAERVGRGLQHRFKGDAVWNLNRPMRVPGTVNYLNAKKRAKGRQIAPTYVLAVNPATFTLDELDNMFPAPAAAPSAKVDVEPIDMTDVTGNYSLLDPDLVRRFEATWIFRGLWVDGVRNGDTTGSGHVFQMALGMQALGFTGNEFARIVTCWDKVDQTNTDERQLARAWAKAAPTVQAKRAFEDDVVIEPEPPAPDWVIEPAGELDEKKLPRRQWLYNRRLIRGYLSSTVAAGGVGKSSLTMVEAVAMAAKKNILNIDDDHMPKAPLRVLMWNGEDPQQELDLKLAAVMKLHRVTKADLGGRLFVISGRKYQLTAKGAMAKLVEVIKAKSIDVVIIDPFVSSHDEPENDNGAIDRVAKQWSAIAEKYGCAVDLAHHIRKPANGATVDLTVDDARGASALINASRNARVLVPMGVDSNMAKQHKVNGKAYFSIQHASTKANMIPAGVGADWFHHVNVVLDNGDPFATPPVEGDHVGAVEAWVPLLRISDDPVKVRAAQDELRKKEYRHHWSSDDWAGGPIAGVLGLDKDADRKLVETVIKDWLDKGWLKAREGKDKKGMGRKFIDAGITPELFDDELSTPPQE